jgi:hypothetical protein
MSDFESTGGVDPAAFAADLFPPATTSSETAANTGEGHTAVSSGTPEPSAAVSTPTPAAEGAAAQAGMTEDQYAALPKSWRKEMEADWKTASPAIRKYAHEREQQVTEGITRYRNDATSWSKVITPFQTILAEYPDVNPAEILSTLASNHLAMVRASPTERAQHAMALARGYGVELTAKEAAQVAAAGEATAQASQDGFTPAQIEQLNRMLSPVLAPIAKNTEFVNKQLSDAATREVDAFFSDAKNEFVNEVANDILQLMQTGKVESLAEAYELAVMRNPEVKAKYLTKLATLAAPAPTTAVKLPNVKSSATPARKGEKPATMDETMNAVIAKHYS